MRKESRRENGSNASMFDLEFLGSTTGFIQDEICSTNNQIQFHNFCFLLEISGMTH